MLALRIPYAVDSAGGSETGFRSAGISGIVLVFSLGIASVAFAPLLHTLSPVLAIAVQSLLAIAIALVAPAYAPPIAIFGLLFQNLFVSIMSPIIGGASELEFIKGYNFLACAVMWAALVAGYLLRWRSAPAEVTRLMFGGAGVLLVVGIYFAIGFLQDPLAATIYLRNVVLPLMMFHVSLLTASSFPVPVTRILIAIAVATIACGYVELAFRDVWLDLTNGDAYWRFDEIKATDSGVWEKEMRATGNVMVDLKDRFRFDFLNTPLLEGLGLSGFLRVFGPNISAISYAYGLGFFILFLCSTRRYLLAAIALPLAIFCGVKGALILMLFVAAGWVATVMIGALPALIAGGVAALAYAAIGLHVGVQIGDYHVIGFMGGWNGFLQAPFGRGLGVGGNLSADFSSIDWSAAQQAGAVDGAVESAIGVLLYQMGIAALVPLAYFTAIALSSWHLYRASGLLPQGLAAFGILITLVNGIFQEEALFAPLALGMFLSLAGLAIGHAARVQAAAPQPANGRPKFQSDSVAAT
jgi:hypothetical protein